MKPNIYFKKFFKINYITPFHFSFVNTCNKKLKYVRFFHITVARIVIHIFEDLLKKAQELKIYDPYIIPIQNYCNYNK